MKKIILLQNEFGEIGGIETFIINFCKIFSNQYDITLISKNIGKANAEMISNYANVFCNIDKIECDICILTSSVVDEDIFKRIKYKQLFHMIHCNITEMKKYWSLEWKFYDENTKFISVSESARKSFLKEYGIDSYVVPNILCVDKIQLRLLSCTRLSKEKGFERMCQLCDVFDKYNISYIWDIYSNNQDNYEPYKNMIFHKPIKQASRIMKNYDYVVQLSDTESMCITMYESLMSGTPVLVTPFPNAIEEISNGNNGYILPFDMKIKENLINSIVNNIPNNVSYQQDDLVSIWSKILKEEK